MDSRVSVPQRAGGYQNSTDILLLWKHFSADFGSRAHSLNRQIFLNRQVFVDCARNCWVKGEACQQTCPGHRVLSTPVRHLP